MIKLSLSVAAHAQIYPIFVNALLLSPEAPPVDAWDDYLALVRKLKSIGVAGEVVRGIQLYQLGADAELILERAEMRILRDRVSKPIWTVSHLEYAVAARDMLAAAADENGVK